MCQNCVVCFKFTAVVGCHLELFLKLTSYDNIFSFDVKWDYALLQHSKKDLIVKKGSLKDTKGEKSSII